MFKCDTVRISKPLDTIFLVIGFKKNTVDDKVTQCYKDGVPFHFEYYEEKVVASGIDEKSLIQSAKEYKKLLNMGNKHLDETLIKTNLENVC